MKNFKRKLAGFLVFAMVLGIMAPGVVAQAADSDAGSVSVNYSEERLNFTNLPSSAAAVQYGDGTSIEKVKWEEAEVKNGSVEVDLSWVKKNKATTIYYKVLSKDGGVVTNSSITTPVQETKLKAALIATATCAAVKKVPAVEDAALSTGSDDTGYIIVYNSDTNTVVSPGTIEWRKGTTGTWQPMSTLTAKLPTFKAKGATLYFRVEGSSDAWASKEVKFAYKKQANAPKAKVDVSKLTLGLKAGQEYQVVYQGQSWPEDWVNLTDDMNLDATKIKNLTISDLWTESSAPGTGTAINTDNFYDGTALKIRVRTAASSVKGTIPSKAYSFTVKAATMAATASDAGIKLGYDPEKESYTLVNTNEGVDYEYSFVTTDGGIKVSKWTKLAGKKEGKDAKVVAVKETKAKPVLVIRKAGVKGNEKKGIKEFVASEYIEVVSADIKATGKTTLSGASIGGKNAANFSAPIVDAENLTVTVSGSAVSGAATEFTVTIDMDNLSASVTKATADKKVGDASISASALKDGSVTLTISVPAGKTVVNQEVKVAFGKKTTVKLKLSVGAPNSN